ncbi:hypothetical protein D0Y65_006326 [Glycine soja]|uniref:Uncharacterized protein n=1 Tax=Glycine soja TaxID=3848 RepID=A0A445L8N3_GLYSO|nr:hypothetical protein D0Y65_006326 [Glycine soja]
MCAPTVRNVCTLINLFRSKLLTGKCNTNVALFTKPSFESEDKMHLSSEPDLARDTSEGDSDDENEDINDLFDILCYDAKSSGMSIEKKIEFLESLTGKLMQSYPASALDRRLEVDWARDAREAPRVLISLRVDFGPMG